MQAKQRGDEVTGLLDQLVQEQGHLAPGEYAYFFVTGEGRYLPPPHEQEEESSGYVVDRHGRVFFWWLGWDPTSSTPRLTTWRATAAEPRWLESTEYQRARGRVGLSSTVTR